MTLRPISTPRLRRKDLIDIASLELDEIELILESTKGFKDIVTRNIKKVPTLRGKTVVNLFFENSTRTRTSFELAARRLSADVINFDVSTSSVKKGESLLDTVETIEALGADFIIMRHSDSGSHQFLGKHIRASIINAGDGAHAHPTQALLDCFTIQEELGTLKDKHVIMAGDILHSRVARSNFHAMTKLGARITLVGPPTLVPDQLREAYPVSICNHLEEVLPTADVIYMLRIQLERQSKNLLPSLKEYKTLYGMDADRFAKAPEHALILHPGPVNFGVELSRDLAHHPRVKILSQVTNGLAVRMAVLYLLRGAEEHETNAPV
jgi:aspartate carbamoyltransferase catalytic subunit